MGAPYPISSGFFPLKRMGLPMNLETYPLPSRENTFRNHHLNQLDPLGMDVESAPNTTTIFAPSLDRRPKNRGPVYAEYMD
jgi:hypothetical protein